jgi:hypothetical protein
MPQGEEEGTLPSVRDERMMQKIKQRGMDRVSSNPQFTNYNMDAYERPRTQAFGYSKNLISNNQNQLFLKRKYTQKVRVYGILRRFHQLLELRR